MKFSTYLNLWSIFIYTLFTWVNVFFILFGYSYYKKSAEMHFHTKVLVGCWQKFNNEKNLRIKSWQNNTMYEKDSVVEHRGNFYLAIEDRNSIEPGDYFGQLLHVF